MSCLGVPFDILGTATGGNALDGVLCQIVGFTYTLLGKPVLSDT